MLKRCLFNAAVVTILAIGVAPVWAAPLAPSPSDKGAAETETAEQKAFHAKADAALKALDEKMERRNQAARRAVMGICSGCLSRSAAGPEPTREARDMRDFDPFSGSVGDAAVEASDAAVQPAGRPVRPRVSQAPQALPLAPPLQILPDLAR
ncbi:hypothetical protein [Chelatococcus sp. YT9]|uniref:hypothetical protein n=1 Tax=Chelatococcus sp. YT9 TaxID=2835635 RepID=UPI001BD0C1F4|nr:hypothetical protein [Chelatococcus sp. YT9]MBS7699084.1 hypothetical protein [Chelatococcus sp. YT9]